MRNDFRYAGAELKLFSKATNWKTYFSKFLKPYISGSVLEVGPGRGETTPFLLTPSVTNWTCLEPDKSFCDLLNNKNPFSGTGQNYMVLHGDIKSLPDKAMYDCILYIDVLEHIYDDTEELKLAISHLTDSGYLIILSPAYNFLLSDFDKAVGHFRRYTKTSLKKMLLPFPVKAIKIFYIESTGMLLLLINKFLSRRKYPSERTIMLWDRILIPISRFTDKLLRYKKGKTIIAVLQKTNKL